MQRSEGARGSIYDLGYRQYGGPRLGRPAAVLALYVHSLRTVFGFGRGAKAKIIPIALTVLVFIPAVVQLGIASVASGIVEIYRAENYYGFVEIILVLFTAAVAPELVGRDQRNRTLSLYFSRPILRSDYALAKLGALLTALLLLTLIPQAVLFVGNALARKDAFGYLGDNVDDVLPILAAGLLISALLASIGLAIACQTYRRTYSTGGILALFMVGGGLAGTLANALDGEPRRFGVLLSGLHVMRGLTYWLFGLTPSTFDGGRGGDLAQVDLPGQLYVIGAIAFSVVAAGVVVWRYRKIAA